MNSKHISLVLFLFFMEKNRDAEPKRHLLPVPGKLRAAEMGRAEAREIRGVSAPCAGLHKPHTGCPRGFGVLLLGCRDVQAVCWLRGMQPVLGHLRVGDCVSGSYAAAGASGVSV